MHIYIFFFNKCDKSRVKLSIDALQIFGPIVLLVCFVIIFNSLSRIRGEFFDMSPFIMVVCTMSRKSVTQTKFCYRPPRKKKKSRGRENSKNQMQSEQPIFFFLQQYLVYIVSCCCSSCSLSYLKKPVKFLFSSPKILFYAIFLSICVIRLFNTAAIEILGFHSIFCQTKKHLKPIVQLSQKAEKIYIGNLRWKPSE